MGRQHQGKDRPAVWQVPEGSGEQGKMEKTGCEIICGVPMTRAAKGLMMMMMMMFQVLKMSRQKGQRLKGREVQVTGCWR